MVIGGDFFWVNIVKELKDVIVSIVVVVNDDGGVVVSVGLGNDS